MAKKIPALLLLMLLASTAFPQTTRDTLFVAAARQNATAIYLQAMHTQSRLYNGSKYFPPDHTLEEHPFFHSADWITGSVYYDGEYFRNVPLMYDMAGQMLMTEHAANGHAIRLVEEKLAHFTLDGHYFQRIINDSVANSLPSTGFYEVLYHGPTKVVMRRQSTLREQIISGAIERSYDHKSKFFVMRNGVFFPVKSKASVLKLLSNRKNELKRFVRQRKLSFSDNRQLALKSMAEHYDTIK